MGGHRSYLDLGVLPRPQELTGTDPPQELGVVDEPNPWIRLPLQDELQRVQERTGATIVFVTHDIDEAIYLSDRIVVLEGSPATIGEEIPVDLPRPRDQLTTKERPEFLRARRAVYDAIVDGHD